MPHPSGALALQFFLFNCRALKHSWHWLGPKNGAMLDGLGHLLLTLSESAVSGERLLSIGTVAKEQCNSRWSFPFGDSSTVAATPNS